MKNFAVNRRYIFFITTLILLLDQFSKHIIVTSPHIKNISLLSNLFALNLVRNTGAAFSLFQNYPFFLSFVSLLATILLIFILTNKPSLPFYKGIAFALLLAGTLGNGIDRWRLGYVIDFIEIVPFDFPIFNLADISINLAIFILLVENFKIPIGNNILKR